MKTGLFLSFLFLGAALTPAAVAQAPGGFTSTGTMNDYRAWHTATLLLNGKVLIAGGGFQSARSADLYDPVTGTFTPTGNMTAERRGHSATLLPDGRVLIVGGQYANQPSEEVYDPSTGTFSATAAIPPAFGSQSNLLNNGKVLLSGGGISCPNGNDGCVIINKPEIYDPATGTATVTGDYADKTGDPYFGDGGLIAAPSVLLPAGKVLIAAETTAEIYDPAAGTFRFTSKMTRGVHDYGQSLYSIGGTATLLTNGTVLLAGGELFEYAWLADAELYDPSTEKFTAIHAMNGIRSGHTATLLRDGTVLVAGGDHTCKFAPDVLHCDALATGTEIYDPATQTFSAGQLLSRFSHGNSAHGRQSPDHGRQHRHERFLAHQQRRTLHSAIVDTGSDRHGSAIRPNDCRCRIFLFGQRLGFQPYCRHVFRRSVHESRKQCLRCRLELAERRRG